MLVLDRITQIRGFLLTDIIEINCCSPKFELCHFPVHTCVSARFTPSLTVSTCFSNILYRSFSVTKNLMRVKKKPSSNKPSNKH